MKVNKRKWYIHTDKRRYRKMFEGFLPRWPILVEISRNDIFILKLNLLHNQFPLILYFPIQNKTANSELQHSNESTCTMVYTHMIKQKAIQGLTQTSDIRVEFLSSVTGNIKQQIIINQCTGSRPSFRAKGLICACIPLDIKTVTQTGASPLPAHWHIPPTWLVD